VPWRRYSLSTVSAAGPHRVGGWDGDNRITVIARFGEMPLANPTPVKGNGAAIIGAAHRVLDQPFAQSRPV
jgi:hypothetical protein